MTYMELHQDFLLNSRNRWRQRVDGLEVDDPARLRIGYGEIAFSISGLSEPFSDESLATAWFNRPRGWHCFSTDDWRYVDGDLQEIERWRGDPERFPLLRTFAKYDFGRIQFAGNVYQREGFDESWHQRDPGTVFDITAPICDVGCMLLYAADIAEACGENLDIIVSYSYSGICGRRLDMSLGWFDHIIEYISDADVFCSAPATFSVRQIRSDLPAILHNLMVPLFKKFGDYALRHRLVDHYVHQDILGNFPMSQKAIPILSL